MNRRSLIALFGALPLLTACASASSGAGSQAASAQLRDASGQMIGDVRFTGVTGGVRVRVSVRGVSPGAHGLHLHAVGACDGSTTPAFSSAGGHFNPTGKQHGHENPAGPHLGDLPNLVVDANGTGSLDLVAEWLTLGTGDGTLFDADGSALVLHQNQDDQRTDSGPQGPGNSGARVACGVLTRS